MLQTLAWTGQVVRLLDQTRLPMERVHILVADEKQMWDAIKRLAVRGAPAIGVAAAFGVYLGVRRCPAGDLPGFQKRLLEVCDYLATSRPTAVNLFWAIERMKRIAATTPGDVPAIQDRLRDECLAMVDEDARVCRAIGEHGLKLLRELAPPSVRVSGGEAPAINVLTHCNAGALATVRYGTALAPIYIGAERGMKFHVWADETRPLLQGARITAAELQDAGIAVTVLCDNMAATVMSQGKVQAVIVGADRIAANGDTANKIGTHGVAILARHFGIPFYVAAPTSTVDLSLPDGSGIPIEQRDPREVSSGFGRQTVPDGVAVFNPAFDVTPAELITAIITEKAILRPPFGFALATLR